MAALLSQVFNVLISVTKTKEALHDYTKLLRYGDIDFSAKIKVTNGMPAIVADDDPDGETVKIGLIDRSFVVDENLNLELKLDSNKMSDKELTSFYYKC